jgi:hypothetical protein
MGGLFLNLEPEKITGINFCERSAKKQSPKIFFETSDRLNVIRQPQNQWFMAQSYS